MFSYFGSGIIMSEFENDKYQRIVENLKQLPSLPAVATKLMQIVNSPESSADDAAALIERDPALTSTVIRMANSAFYGMPRSTSTVSSAVVILGFNTIRTIVLSTSIVKAFPQMVKSDLFQRQRFWRHSIVCALAAKILIRLQMYHLHLDPESAFCAGILHDPENNPPVFLKWPLNIF
jgi:HD-like signal output (HDOD) protein